jgi:predicted RNA-binding protein with PUA-like domain
MRRWLFQGNPDLWPVLDVLARGEPIRSWTALRYRDLLAPGDGGMLWISGRHAGVYAVGAVTGTPEPSAPGRTGRPRWHVGVELEALEEPIPRDELRADPRWAHAAILRAPRSANPFPVTAEEWAAVEDRLP